MNPPKTPSLLVYSDPLTANLSEYTQEAARQLHRIRYRLTEQLLDNANPVLNGAHRISIPTLDQTGNFFDQSDQKFDLLIETICDISTEKDRIESLAKKHALALVVDHYIQAEAISKIAQESDSGIRLLVAIESVNQSIGTMPGASVNELLKGINSLMGVYNDGVLFFEAEQSSIPAGCESVTTSCLVASDIERTESSPFAEWICYPWSKGQIISSINASVISRPRKNRAVLNLGAYHFRNGFDSKKILETFRKTKEDEFALELKIIRVNDYEMAIEVEPDFGSFLIGNYVEIALLQPEACLLPAQFV